MVEFVLELLFEIILNLVPALIPWVFIPLVGIGALYLFDFFGVTNENLRFFMILLPLSWPLCFGAIKIRRAW